MPISLNDGIQCLISNNVYRWTVQKAKPWKGLWTSTCAFPGPHQFPPPPEAFRGNIMATGNLSWLTFGSTSRASPQTVFEHRLSQKNQTFSRRLLVYAAKSSPFLSGERDKPQLHYQVITESRMMALPSRLDMGKQMTCFKPTKLRLPNG